MLTGDRKSQSIWAKLLLFTMVLSILSLDRMANIGTAYAKAERTDIESFYARSEIEEAVGLGAAAKYIVKNGRPHAVIVIGSDEDARIRAAADTLAEYVQKSTGALLPVVTEEQLKADAGKSGKRVQIYVGAGRLKTDPHLENLLQGIDGDGFVIHPHGHRITIAGPTSWGTQFGVYAFLERYVGVRWLMPGPDGEDVPSLIDLPIPQQDAKEEPAFMSRVFSPLNGERFPIQVEWANKNRMHGRIEFHHNVYSLFPPEQYGQTNPEFYPVRNGVPYIPAADSNTYWQPCYSEPGTIEAAINKIIAYFAANPDVDSFSLGVNDGRGYCETEPDHPQKPTKLNSVGLPDMSDIYYGWVNAVAEGVLEVYPDKWFGLLAYDNVMDPPSFKLNSRVVPFITQDRMVWSDPSVENASKQKLEEWSEAADYIALYDYIYGTPYMVPRMYMEQMAVNYAYADTIGVLAHYAELYPNWGEGPKPWVAARLQWDPDQDVDTLLDEWYTRAVGEAAAGDLRAYYDYWENFWTVRIHDSEWFESRKNATYLEFVLADYLNLVTQQDISYSRSLLESVAAKAETAKQKTRAAMLLRAFEYYEASALSYPKKVNPLEDEATALALLNGVDIERNLFMAQRRKDLIEEYKNDEVLVHPIDPKAYPNLNWTGWNANEFWELADYQRERDPGSGAVAQRVHELAQGTDMKSEYARVLQEAALNRFPMNGNPSFEETAGIAPWSLWVDGPPAAIARTEEAALPGGTASLLVSNLTKGGPIQTFDVKPGLMASRVHYYTPSGTKTSAIIRLSFNYMDKDGKVLGNTITPARLVSSTAGEWAEVRVLGEIPERLNNTEVKKVQMIVYINNVEQNTKLYLDDAVFFQSNQEFVTPRSFWNVYDYIAGNEPGSQAIRQRAESLAGQAEATEGREFAQLLLKMLDGSQPVNNDPSFELGTGQGPGSTVNAWSQFGSMQRVTDPANLRTGSAGISLSGSAQTRFTAQYFTFEPGATAARVYYKLPAGTTSPGTIQLSFNLLSTDGKALGTLRSQGNAVADSQGEWVSSDFAFMLPASVNNIQVGKVQFVLIVNGIAQPVPIYLDDAAVYQ